MRIPKIIHQIWKTRHVPSIWQDWAASWRCHHPGWEYRLWTDADLHDFVAARYPDVLPVYEAFSYDIQRADAARYMILHAFGGVYADLDLECLRPIDGLIEGRAFVVGGEPKSKADRVEGKRRVSNAFLAAAPGHPVLGTVIEELKKTRAKIVLHREVLETTGPEMLTRVLGGLGSDADMAVLDARLIYPVSASRRELRPLLGGRSQALKAKLIAQGSYTIHYWANSWVRNLAGALENPYPYRAPGYRFYPGLDSPHHDLRNAGRNVVRLARECDADPRAVAFNTDGYLKYRIASPFRWEIMASAGPGEGLYVKKSAHPVLVHVLTALAAHALRGALRR